MSSRKTNIRILVSITMLSVAAVATGTLAWFYSTNKISQINGKGSTESAYFAYGTGTAEDPFGIADVRHLNNLAWLQYNGNFDNDHFYFELANDINASGTQYAIPPIGTEDHPFIGVFNGNGHTVNNIKVTNDPASFSNKPTKITYNQNKAEVVGFFGVVGELEGESYTSSTNTLKDVTLDNLVVESKTSATLIGLAAGYVNAEMSGVKVGTSKISVNGNSAKSYTNNLSDYGLVGYTTKTATSGSYQQKISGLYDSSKDGDGANWGGSIDFKTFYDRLNTIKNNYSRTNYSLGFVYDDAYSVEGERISHTVRSGKTKSYAAVYNDSVTKNGITYNEKVGALKANMNNNSTLYYLAGGHYTVAKTRHYYDHEGFKIYKTVGGVTHYLGASNTTIANNVAIADKSGANASQALVWELPAGSSGKVTTKYNNTTYYLAIASNGTDLVIRSSSANGTTFTKAEDGNGGIRLSIAKDGSNSYLDYSNGWKMVNPPTLSPYNPPEVTAPNPGTEEEYAASHGLNPDNYHGAYQITYMDGDTKRFISVSGSSIVSSTEPYTNGWNFNGGTSLPTSGNNTTIRLYNSNYQIGHSNDSSLSYTNSDTQWTANQTNGTWKFSYNTGGGCDGTTTHYMRRSGSTLSVGTNNSDNTFTLEATATSVSTYNSSLHDAWVAATNLYNSQVEARDEYINVTRPAEEATYNTAMSNHNTAFATAYLPIEEISQENNNVVSGPDYRDVARYEGMDYEYDQDVTYLPLAVNDSLEAKSTNTGYIIGGQTHNDSIDSSSASLNGNIRVTSMYTISDCIKNFNRSTGTFNANSIYTYDASGIHKINDTDNTYVKYKESKAKIEETLSSNGDSVSGLHFTATGITKDALVTAKYAVINGEEFSNYKMPANSIDFNLREQGIINFFAGTYGNSGSSATTVDSFFSLHQIQRNGTTIESIDEIQEIYSDGIHGHSYIYKFTDGSYSVPYSIDQYSTKKFYVLGTKYLITDTAHGGYSDGIYHKLTSAEFNAQHASTYSMLFDMSWLKDHSYYSSGSGNITEAFHMAFYFEIPTNPGEYALGTVTGKTYGAYLIYLDIAANAANKDKVTSYAVYTYQSGLDYPVGVDFNVSTLTTESNGGETAAIIIFDGATSSGDVDFEVSGSTINYESDFTTKYSYTAIPLSGADPPQAADVPPANGTRTIHTKIVSTDSTVWNIVTIEDLDAEGEPSGNVRYVTIKHGDETLTENDLPDSFVLSTIRKNVKEIILTLTRESGTNTFDAIADFSGADGKDVDITLDATGIVIEVSDKASGYNFTINGTAITTDPQIYPQANP